MAFNGAYLNVTGNVFFDPSGSSAAAVNATNVTVNGTLTTNNLVTPTTLNTTNNLTVGGNLAVGGNLTGTGISASFKEAMENIIDEYSFSQAVFGTSGESVKLLGYTGVDGSNHVFTPGISVCIMKDNEMWEYGNGIVNAFNPGVAPEDGIHSWYCATKTIITTLYARLKTIGVIPFGTAYKMSNLFPQMATMKFYIPTLLDTSSNSAYASIIPNTDTSTNVLYPYIGFKAARTLYLEDVLAENIGFFGGFTWVYNKSLTSQSLPVRTYRAACLSTYDSSFNEGSGTSQFVWSVLNQSGPFGVQVDSQDAINNWLNQFVDSSKNVVMWSDNGIFNYNISQNIGCAALLAAYRNYYPSWVGDFYDLIKLELLDKVGSNLFWFFDSSGDSRFQENATIWSAYSNTAAGTAPGNGYAPQSPNYNALAAATYAAYLANPTYNNLASVNTYDASDPSGFRQQRYKISTYDSSSCRPRNYYGNGMVFGTNADYVKVVSLIARNGLDASGNRLISAAEISNLKYPRFSQTEAVNYSGVTIFTDSNKAYQTLLFNNLARNFALGGYTRGPGFTNPQTINANGTAAITTGSQGFLNIVNGQVVTDFHLPMETFGWYCNAAGCWIYIHPQNNAVMVISTDDQLPLMSLSFVYQKLLDTWSNFLMNPGSPVTALGYKSYYQKQL